MNENLKFKKKQWDKNIPIDFPETNNISTNINCPINEIIIWKGNQLNYQYLKSIDENQRDEIAKDLLNFFLKYDFTKFKYDINDINDDWEELKDYKVEIIKDNDKTYINNVSASGTIIYKYFFPNYLKIRDKDRPSVYGSLTNKEILFKIIRNRIGNTLLYNTNGKTARQWPMNISPRMMIQGSKCSGYASSGSIFKPVVAKAIYSKWTKDGDNVLDYSSGFGGRLLGLMALQSLMVNNKYFGIEPDIETHNNLIKMSKHFDFNVDIRNVCSEDFIFEEKMDFIFSSPPYFNHEIYSDDIAQCYNRFPTYEEWLEKYWRKTVQNCKQMMKEKSVFAVNIGNSANQFMKQISDDFQRIISEEGLKLINIWHLKTFRSHLSSKKESGITEKFEGIYFYGNK